MPGAALAEDLSDLRPAARAFVARTQRLFIGGQWLPAASGKTFETLDPATEKVICQVALGDAEDVDKLHWRNVHASLRRVGAQKYMLAGRPKLLTLDTPSFVVADACSMAQNIDITPSETTRTLALLRLRKYEQEHPADKNRFRVVPFYLAA